MLVPSTAHAPDAPVAARASEPPGRDREPRPSGPSACEAPAAGVDPPTGASESRG